MLVFAAIEKNNFLLLKFIKFIIIFLMIDFAFGIGAKRIYFSQKSGKHYRINYSIKKADSEILIFGSSHASRHYVPDIFEKKMRHTCYNAGVQGQGLIFHLVLLKMILERSKPKLVILNIDDDWLYRSEKVYDRLCDLFPYYWEYRNIIRPVLNLNSNFIDFKLFLKSYQTNSTIVHVFKYYFLPQIDFNGYRPLFNTMKQSDNFIHSNTEKRSMQAKELDENFVLSFKSFITTSKNSEIELLFVVSPTLRGKNYSKNLSMIKMKTIAKKENVSFIDFSKDKNFINNYKLFDDEHHLNDEGAHLFSKLLTELISTQCLKENRISGNF